MSNMYEGMTETLYRERNKQMTTEKKKNAVKQLQFKHCHIQKVY